MGGHVRDGESGLNQTHVLRSAQAPFSFTCATNPVEILFVEPVSQITFELYTWNDFMRIQDDTGWSETISVRSHANGVSYPYYRATVTVPSNGVRSISIKDLCSYGITGCDPWRLEIDNLSFRPDRPCLAVFGPGQIEPNRAGATSEAISVVVEVTDCEGNILSDIAVEITASVDFTSGGHSANHAVPTRPQGGLRDDITGATGPGEATIIRTSDADGQILLQFVPPEVAGTHSITASCVDIECYEPDPPLSVDVRIDGLEPIPPSNVFYTLTEYLPGTVIGKNIGDNGKHNGVNHHLTPEAADSLWRLAFEYALTQNFQPVPQKLHINDASLPTGGLFDVGGQWAHPHKLHRKGSVVDIRANQAPGAIPTDLYATFAAAASYAGGMAKFENYPKNPANNHFHVRLMGVQE